MSSPLRCATDSCQIIVETRPSSWHNCQPLACLLQLLNVRYGQQVLQREGKDLDINGDTPRLDDSL
jgi:hypothetical protein